MQQPQNANASNVCFVVFSDDWGVHPSSSQHLFRHLAEENQVNWINTIGMRRPRFEMTDLLKAGRKITGMLRTTVARKSQSAPTNVRVYQPFMIPFNDIAWVRRFNNRSMRRTLDTVARGLQCADVIVVSTVPNACDYVDAIAATRIVYYCVDDFSEWPGLDKALVLEMEAMLVNKSDAFLATSPALYDRLSATGKPTALLSHGVDVELFATDADSVHPVLGRIPEPRAGYFGLFDARSDQDLIVAAARQRPDMSFVIAGRVEVAHDALDRCGNVHFVGPIPYAELPALVKGLNVLFIPYAVNALTDALSPLKFKEYLATGRPVISTPIAAAFEFAGHIYIAGTATEWLEAFDKCLSGGDGVPPRVDREYLERESWSGKAKRFLDFCMKPVSEC